MEFAKVRTLGEPVHSIDPYTGKPVVIPPWTIGKHPLEDAYRLQEVGKLQVLAGLTSESLIYPTAATTPEAPSKDEPVQRMRRTYKRRDMQAEAPVQPVSVEDEPQPSLDPVGAAEEESE